MSELGLPINEIKLVPPNDVMICIGIEVDVKRKTLKIPGEKVREIQEVIQQFQDCTRFTAQRLQSLLGKLLYVSKVMVPARGFFNCRLRCLQEAKGNKWVKLTKAFYNDMKWFGSLFGKLNDTFSFRMVGSRDQTYLWMLHWKVWGLVGMVRDMP